MNFFFKKKIGILGLGRSGISSFKFLKKKGFTTVGWDDNLKIRLQAKNKGVKVENFNNSNLKNFFFIVVSPGISSSGSKKHSIIKKAEKKKIEIVNDIELFFRFNPEISYIGVTGTNGKSTTVSLLKHVFNKLKIKNSLAGNIGKPVFDLRNLKKKFYILEVSSFQLELMKRVRFKIAVLLNISNDHLERHGGFKKYFSEKIKIFNNQNEEDISIVGIDNKETQNYIKRFKKKLSSNLVTISHRNNKSDLYINKKDLIINFSYKNKRILKKINLAKFKNIRGQHNYENIAAVYAIIIFSGCLNWRKIEDAIKSFRGLPHRLQKIREIKNVTYINDSKATNLDATDKALSSYNNIYWILGGKIKEKSLKNLKKHFFKIKHVFLLGESKFLYEKYIKKHLNYTVVNNLRQAVKFAHSHIQKELKYNSIKPYIVLFSPACSSLDEWKNFEHRGNAFIKYVNKL